jgi:exodeoxyribonuclease V beta subunit
LLEVFDRLASLQKDAEMVTRHVESDAAAVQIMTIHKAKGLEFPCVVVADLWKPKDYKQVREAPRFRERDADGTYVDHVDVGWVLGKHSESSELKHERAQMEEQRRLLYVALTRAESHLSFMWPSASPKPSIFNEALNIGVIGSVSDAGMVLVGRLALDDLPTMTGYRYRSDEEQRELVVAIGPSSVEQSLRRTSFTGITRAQMSLSKRLGAPEYDLPGSGNDENTNPFASRSRYASAETPTGAAMPLARLLGGKHVGKVLHRVYELIDTSAPDLRAEVATKCSDVITGGQLATEMESVIDGIMASLVTPLGPEFGDESLADIGSANRLPELDFEMSVATLAAGVKVSDFGRILDEILDSSDVLRPYADYLSHESFNIDLAGLVNGSIDAVLQLGTNEEPALWITDYKSNRLDQDGDLQVIDGYRQDRLFEAMVHHHYPLQALIYGAAMYRYLRWRMPKIQDHSAHIKGFAYFFIRGMVGVDTPREGNHPHGVFTWVAPPHLWQRLSDRLAGDTL